MNNILALIPAYDEQETVKEVVEHVGQYLPVLVVDDGSEDATATRAEAAGAEVLRQSPNQGKGVTLQNGFRWALERGYDAVITLDADGQHHPDEIPVFVEAYEEHGYDLVIGSREFRRMPFVRRCSNTVGRWTFSWALGQYVHDNQSGYRLVSRRLMEASLASCEPGFHFEVDIIVICVLEDFKLGEVPIRTIYAGESSHVRPLRHVYNFFRLVWQTWKRVHLPHSSPIE
jgi:glycosyltransferase involved in cell wall biosynthesis